MTDFAALLKVLTNAHVGFIIVGGAAATAHGSARLTQDLEAIAELEIIRDEKRILGQE